MAFSAVSMNKSPLKGFSGHISIDDFMAVPDDLKELCCWQYSLVRKDEYYRIVNNDEKIGFYKFKRNLGRNQKGKWFVKSTLDNWMVYNHKTKKISYKDYYFYDRALEYFNIDYEYIKLFNVKPSKTFIKKVFQGKMNTIRDILQYEKSYVIKNKKLTLEQVGRICLINLQYTMYKMKNPEDISDKTDVEVLDRIKCSPKSGYDVNDFKPIQYEDDEYKRLDNFLSSRKQKSGDSNDERSNSEVSDDCATLYPF